MVVSNGNQWVSVGVRMRSSAADIHASCEKSSSTNRLLTRNGGMKQLIHYLLYGFQVARRWRVN